jgi:hypothetical protein
MEDVAARPLRRNVYDLSGAGRSPGARLRATYYLELARKLRIIYQERAQDVLERRRYQQPVADRAPGR